MSRILQKNRADRVENIVEILYTIAKVPKHYAANVTHILRNLVVAKSFDQFGYQSQMPPHLEKVDFFFQILAD
ncbi:MAG: hypothetical protein V7K79_27110 [Nostoc sp.]